MVRAALLGPAEVRALAAGLELTPTKRLGQNFVIDPNTIRRIVTAARIREGDEVLEVGPGLGSLTLGLVAAGAHVVAIEIDHRLATRLTRTIGERAPGANVTVVEGDAVAVQAAEVGSRPTALVANLPYNVAVPALLHLLDVLPSLRHALVMVQEEVADRIAAVPGTRVYGVPSVKLAWYGKWEVAGLVGPNVFWPAPNVGSALLRFTAYSEGGMTSGSRGLRDRTFEVVDAAFSARRKTLRQSLAGWAGSASRAGEILSTAGVDPGLRAERLRLGDFRAVAEAAEAER